MSASKKDRTTAPRLGTRASRARHVDDRNVRPPAGYRRPGKPKPGEHAMEEQLAADEAAGVPSGATEGDLMPPSTLAPASLEEPVGDAGAGAVVLADPDDEPPPSDPWWTDEREKAFTMALQGIPQHQIADALGRNRHTVARWADSEKFTKRLFDENASRFHATRQRRAMQTVRLTDRVERLATTMMDKAIEMADDGKDNLGVRLAARDWLQEFRENSRREDEIYGVGGTRVDVNVRGAVQHKHQGKVDVSFKTFLATSLRGMGVDPDKEEVDAGRADEALATVTERALMEGSFLDDLVDAEKAQLAPMVAADRRNSTG